jgi:hypothetical protein
MKLLGLAVLVGCVSANPTNLPCDRNLEVGVTIMGAAAVASDGATIEFRRDGTPVTSHYIPGEVS